MKYGILPPGWVVAPKNRFRPKFAMDMVSILHERCEYGKNSRMLSASTFSGHSVLQKNPREHIPIGHRSDAVRPQSQKSGKNSKRFTFFGFPEAERTMLFLWLVCLEVVRDITIKTISRTI